MKRINRILVTGCLVVVLLIAEIVIIRTVSGYQSKTKVVFTKVNIPEGTLIKENMLEIIEVDAGIVPKSAVRNVKEVAGKEAGIDMAEKEMVMTEKLRAPGESGKIKVVNEGNRLFSVEFKSDQVNGWQISAGQYVDIIFIPDGNAGLQTDGSEEGNGQFNGYEVFNNVERLVSSHAFPGIKVLKNIRIAAVINEQGELLKGNDLSGTPKIISFEVSEGQDHFLAWAKSHGRLEISLIQRETVQK